MKTVLIYTAQDILIRQAIHNRLEENGIKVFGADSSINVVYPNTPNLYLAGASAIFEGYRILVYEEEELKAKKLIEELEAEFQEFQNEHLKQNEKDGVSINSQKKDDYFRRFQLFSFISLMIPVLPIPMALFYLYKLIQSKQPIILWKVFLLLMILSISLGLGLFVLKDYLNYGFIFRSS